MNRKRNLLSAACLGLVGTLLLIGYVRAAEGKASAGQQLVPVVVVRDSVPRGATSDQLREALEVKQVPADVKAQGAFSHLDDIGQRLPATELYPGEQLVADRLGAPDEVGHQLPEGTTAVSLSLEPQRAIGGLLKSGTRVNVLVSYDDPDSTGTVLRDVAVESVVQPAEEAGAGTAGAPILVTFSVSPADAEKLVYAADHGKIWLAGAANVDLVPKVER